jgi:hypothetical protein
MRSPPRRHVGGAAAAGALRSWSRSAGVAVCALTLAADASAQSWQSPRFHFGGFGTLGVIHSEEDRADFVADITRPEGAGFSGGLKASVDSRLAAQGTMLWGTGLMAVLQVVAEQTSDGDYRPHAEWANLGFALRPDLRVRGGRIAMPAFLISEARKVSFANPWIRPPVEFYGLVPVYTLDGVDASWRTRTGQWTGDLNAVAGTTKTKYFRGTIAVNRLWSVNSTLARGPLTARLAVGAGRLRIDAFAPLFESFRAFGPQGQAIADRYGTDDRALQFAAAGMEYDPGTWFAMAETGRLDTRSALGERVAGYVTGGVRIGAVVPYATFSRAGRLSESGAAGLTLDGLPPEHAAAAAELNAALETLIASAPIQQNLSVGARWDLAHGVALKAQLDFVSALGDSPGTFINVQPGFESGGRARVFSVASAFVF